MPNNVLSFGMAIAQGFEPKQYPYQVSEVPIGHVEAILDFKVWAKKLMGISCFFTEARTGRHFLLTVYCTTRGYRVTNSQVDFSSCPIQASYSLIIGKNYSGNLELEKVTLI